MPVNEQDNKESQPKDFAKNIESSLNEIKKINKSINDNIIKKGNEIKETINKSNNTFKIFLIGLTVALMAGYLIAQYNFKKQSDLDRQKYERDIQLDRQKYERDIKNSQDTSIFILCNELSNNMIWSDATRTRLRNEYELITKESTKGYIKHLVDPLIPLQIGAWDLLKINKPNTFLTKNIISKIIDYNYLLIIINKIIEFRDLYKINDTGMQDFQKTLEIYDLNLNTQLKELNKKMTEINKLISNECDRVNFSKKK